MPEPYFVEDPVPWWENLIGIVAIVVVISVFVVLLCMAIR